MGNPKENPLELSAFLFVLLLLQDHIAIDVAILCQTLSSTFSLPLRFDLDMLYPPRTASITHANL
jgi:hypothetical protein